MAVGRGTARAYGYLPVGMRNQEEHRQHALEAESTKKVHLFYYHNIHVVGASVSEPLLSYSTWLYIYIYIYPYVKGPPCIKPVLLTQRAPAKYTTSTFRNPTKWPEKKAPIYKTCTSYVTCSGQVYDVRIP